MAKLCIWISDTDRTLDFDSTEVLVGRDPTFDVVVEGPAAHVVSTRHARFFYSDNAWWIEDSGSSNGTLVGANLLSPNLPVKLSIGDSIRLGQDGVTIRIEKSSSPVPVTMLESAAVSDEDATQKMDSLADVAIPSPPPTPEINGEFEELRSGKSFAIVGTRVRLGRGKECEIRPVETGDTSVSRVHAEIRLKPDGRCVIADAKSRNGTLVNGDLLQGERELVKGDVVTLGEGGPHLSLVKLKLPDIPVLKTAAPDLPPPVAVSTPPAVPPPVVLPQTPPRRSFGGKGATQYIKGLMDDVERRSTNRSKIMAGAIVVVVAGALGVGYWYAEDRVAGAIEEQQEAIDQQRTEMLAQRSASDSVTAASAAEMDRLRSQLSNAQLGSAPTGMLDSLRAELAAASQRTEDLEASFTRAQRSLAQQVAAGDSLRREAETNLRRLRTELNSANSGGSTSSTGVSQAQLDSLRQAIAGAESRVTEMSGRMRAVQGVDLAAIAQANQGAVGMVTAYRSGGVYDGSGFMLTESGFFVTNRHVAQPEGRRADSLFIVMADSRRMMRAEVIRVAPPSGPDVAVLQVRNYQGPVIARVDWTGTRVGQGEPAALIGLPAGAALAINRQTGTVQTSMSAGIFSKVEENRIQFDGFTIGGSSGSPVFNGDGEVVAIHYAGLEDVAGLGFAVPITKLIAFLPAEVKREFNIR
jgi:pSer/pThr/pTyr-binding forkhead associated (FHA) protein/S1-C subfamily serine protease